MIYWYSHSCPFRKYCPLTIHHIDKFIYDHENLTNVANQEKDDDTKEDQRYAVVAASASFSLDLQFAEKLKKQF